MSRVDPHAGEPDVRRPAHRTSGASDGREPGPQMRDLTQVLDAVLPQEGFGEMPLR